MLTATVDGKTISAATIERGLSYKCPECKEAVILKRQKIKIPHFAHRPDADCDWGTGETEEHREAKFAIYSALGQEPDAQRVELEFGLFDPGVGNAVSRPDVLARIRGGMVAFELQRSNLSIDKLIHRTSVFARKKISVLWIVVNPRDFDVQKFSPNVWERWLHAAYLGRVYYWLKEWPSFVLPVHFGPHIIYKPPRSWFDENGDEQSVGGYERHSKRWRMPVVRREGFGRGILPVHIVRDFSPKILGLWKGESISLPARRIWMDTKDNWWLGKAEMEQAAAERRATRLHESWDVYEKSQAEIRRVVGLDDEEDES